MAVHRHELNDSATTLPARPRQPRVCSHTMVGLLGPRPNSQKKLGLWPSGKCSPVADAAAIVLYIYTCCFASAECRQLLCIFDEQLAFESVNFSMCVVGCLHKPNIKSSLCSKVIAYFLRSQIL
jgi:hypothetical protein